MKIRTLALLLAALAASALLVAGCGDSDSSSSSSKKQTKAEKAAQKDADDKQKQVDAAEKAYKKAKDDVNACRNLGLAWIAKASPASSTDPKKPAELPKDRDKSLDEAIDVLQDCVKINAKDRGVQQMLASTYLSTSQYDKASPLLEQLAKSAPAAEKANAYYAWGLAESNAQEYGTAITAWNGFLASAPKNDPRIDQVKQSIKSLKAAAAQAKTAAAKAASTTKDEDAKDDDSDAKGGDDK